MLKKVLLGFITYSLLLTAFSVWSPEIAAQDKKALKRAKKFTDDGNKLFGQKKYQLAIDNYAQAIVVAPNLPEPHFWKGYAHYYLKDYDNALTEINRAEDLNFNKPVEIYKIRWFLNFEKKNYDEAFEDVQKGLQVEPTNLTLIVASGDVNRVKGNHQEAINAYSRALQMKPNNGGDLNYFVAFSQFNLGNTKAQGESAAEAVRAGTLYVAEAYALMGDAFQKQREYPKAIDAYMNSLASKQENYAVYRSLADIYRNQNRFNDAIEVSKKALRLFPNDGNLYTDLSWYYSLSNRHEDAVQAASAGTRLLPNQSLAYTNLCRAYNDTKQFQQAINACNRALQLTPDDGETNFYLGYAYQSTGKSADALKYFKKAVVGLIEFTKNNPDYSDGFYLLGNAYLSDSQPKKAIEAYRRCLEISPRFSRARYNLGLAYIANKEKNPALEQHNALLNLDKDLAGKLKAEIDEM